MKILSRSSSLCLTTVAGIFAMTTQVQAGSITLNATTFGNYNNAGIRNTTTYLTGKNNTLAGTADTNRSFFVFNLANNDLNAAYRTILNSQLTLFNPANGYTGPAGSSRTFNVTNVTTANIGSAGNSTAIFADLGTTGTGNVVYGSTSVSSANNNSNIIINLGSNANANILANANTTFAVGGALTGLTSTTATQQRIFFNSNSAGTKQLLINFADAQAETNGDQQFGNVLVGQTRNVALTVTNRGEVGSQLTGTIGASSNPLIIPTSGLQNFTNLGSGQSATRTFTFTPTQRNNGTPTQTTISLTSNTQNAISNPLFTGSGVAPQNAITNSNPDAGFVRIGTSETVGVTIQNVGDGNLSGQGAISNLNGTSSLTGSSSHFIPTTGSVGNLSLTDNVSQTLNFAYTPTTHGAESQVLNLAFTNGSTDGTNQAQTRTVNLAGYGVGAVYQSSPVPDSTLDFGKVLINQSAVLPLTITNATQDPTNTLNLTGLTLLNAFFDGPDAEFFSLLNFTRGTQLAKGNSLPLQVKFTSTNLNGPKNATLRILTDQGVAFGQAGQTFSYNLTATTIPEPSSVLAMAILGTTGLFFKRKPN